MAFIYPSLSSPSSEFLAKGRARDGYEISSVFLSVKCRFMKVAVVGVTGLVGTVMLQVLEESNMEISELIPVASSRSVGKKINFKNKEYSVVSMQDGIDAVCDIALFSAGGGVSKEYAPLFAEKGTVVIDNSSAWRMDDSKKLVVPEINGKELTPEDKIIANPNCSTIQMVLALAPLHRKYGIKRLVISTYQTFTGTGAVAVKQYQAEKEGTALPAEKMAYHHPIFENCIPHCGDFVEQGYTTEEIKMVNETRKILGDPDIPITATAIRVPVDGGHSEAINVEFKEEYDLAEVKALLNAESGITVQDDPESNSYPMPLMAKGKNDVFVGRIRRDFSIKNGLNLWVVSDNLRKGAATNAVQIAQFLINNK
jgi:aspartate-semialdehyde dehydrogenase